MLISEILERSYRLLHDEHIGVILHLPEKYLEEFKPNKQIHFTKIFDGYNEDIASCFDEYGESLMKTTLGAVQSQGSLSTRDKEEILTILDKYIVPDLYTKRFDIFVNSIENTMSKYALEFDVTKIRIDTLRALAEVHAVNTSRTLKSKITNELDVHLLKMGTLSGGLGYYKKLNNLYNDHQLTFWGAGIIVSLILGALFV